MTPEFICGGGRYRLADHHDIIAAGRAANRTLEQIADDLCVERNVLTSAGCVGAYCYRNKVPMGNPTTKRRVLTDKQRAIIKAVPGEKMPYGVRTMLAERFGVSTVTIWKERARR